MARSIRFRGNRIFDYILRNAILNMEQFENNDSIIIFIQVEYDEKFMELFKQVMLSNLVQKISIQQFKPVNLIPFLKLLLELSQKTNSLKKLKLTFLYDHQIQDQEIDLLSECFTNMTQCFILQFGLIRQQQILKLLYALKQKSSNLSYLKLESDSDLQGGLNIKILEYTPNFIQLKKLKLLLTNQQLDSNKKINLKHENCEEILLTVQQLNQIETLKYFNNLRQLSIFIDQPTIQELQYTINSSLFSVKNLITLKLILSEIEDVETEILNQLRFALPKLSQLANLQIILYNDDKIISQIISLLKDNNQIKTFTIRKEYLMTTQLKKEEILNFIHLKHLYFLLDLKQDAQIFLNLENLITLSIQNIQNKNILFKLKRLVSLKQKNLRD